MLTLLFPLMFAPSAFAGQAWSKVQVSQTQEGNGWGSQTALQQAAQFETSVKYGDAVAKSKGSGFQQLLTEGAGKQSQVLGGMVGLQWTDNGCNLLGCSKVVGSTNTQVDQMQQATSGSVMRENAQIKDGIWFNGNLETENEAQAWQNNENNSCGPNGCQNQSQSLKSASGAEGYLNLFPGCSSGNCFDFGNAFGNLVTTVQVVVQNSFSLGH